MTANDNSGTNPILVTGATGRHGNTGEYLVRRLREEGRAVRVLARTPGERTERLAALGAEIVRGDLHDRRTLVPALADVDLAYFTYPIDAGVIPAAANYAAAVREVGRYPRTVVMSMGPSHPESPSSLGRAQWLAEEILDWAGLDLLILRVFALFHENLKILHSRSIREQGLIRNSFGPERVGWISGRDAAELALAGLLHPERFSGQVVDVKGAEELSHVEIASLLSQLAERPVRYEPATQEQWRQDLVELSQVEGEDVVNPAMAQHISSVGDMVARAGRTMGSDRAVLRALIGREPITVSEFLKTNLDRWFPVSV